MNFELPIRAARVRAGCVQADAESGTCLLLRFAAPEDPQSLPHAVRDAPFAGSIAEAMVRGQEVQRMPEMWFFSASPSLLSPNGTSLLRLTYTVRALRTACSKFQMLLLVLK